MVVEHDVLFDPLIRRGLVTSNDLNIFSAAFSCEAHLYNPPIPKSNPYYWRGREDFKHQASPPQSAIDSGEPGLTADSGDEGSASFTLPFPDVGGALPGIVQNGNQLASVPASDDMTDLEDPPWTSPPDLTNAASQTKSLSGNNDMFDDADTGPGEIFPASLGGETPLNSFSVDDSESSTSLGDTSLTFNAVGTYFFLK